jgi:Bacterial protein of unknown function (DUF937)
MNLIDILKDQLGGEVTKSLGRMSGASESDIGKVLGAGLPSILSGLGALASTKQGAGRIADAIGGMDSSLFGNLSGLLGGASGQKGGAMLSGLMSGPVVEGLSTAISKFAGVSPGIVKTVLGYLAPLVLGAIGESFGGGAVDASSVSNLFSQQKSSIASALPKGFSLDGIQGFALLGSGSLPSLPATEPIQSGGSGMLKLGPILAIAAIAGALYYWNTLKKEAEDATVGRSAVVEGAKENAEEAAKSTADAVGGAISAAGDAARDAVEKAGKMASDAAGTAKDLVGEAAKAASSAFDVMKGDFGSIFEGLNGKLGQITDAAGAEEFLPDLKGYAAKLEGMAKGVRSLPAEGKSTVAEMIEGQLDKLNPVFEKLAGIPGVSEAFTKLLEQIKSTLMGLVG